MHSSKGGVYLVRVKPIKNNGIEIAHSCPATKGCWHQKYAIQAYKEWRWWEPAPEKVVCRKEVILLKPYWEQILVPGVITPELEAILDGFAKQHIA